MPRSFKLTFFELFAMVLLTVITAELFQAGKKLRPS